MYLGPEMILSNTVIINNTIPYLKPVVKDHPDPSQLWTVTPQGIGRNKLTNVDVGPDLFMDFCGRTESLCFQGGDTLGQEWALEAIGVISPSNTLYASPSNVVSRYYFLASYR